ncbi:hypothetical protein EDC04DRAFT_2663570 [Pisolithus marmoratus]|nr:hypothetical protein EDC04DRAFT_2663570 [Pisolithus marmoratus]
MWTSALRGRAACSIVYQLLRAVRHANRLIITQGIGTDNRLKCACPELGVHGCLLAWLPASVTWVGFVDRSDIRTLNTVNKTKANLHSNPPSMYHTTRSIAPSSKPCFFFFQPPMQTSPPTATLALESRGLVYYGHPTFLNQNSSVARRTNLGIDLRSPLVLLSKAGVCETNVHDGGLSPSLRHHCTWLCPGQLPDCTTRANNFRSSSLRCDVGKAGTGA